MDEIKAVLREEAEIEDNKTVQVYDVGHYEVTVTGRKDNPKSRIWIHIYHHQDYPKYLPFIDVSTIRAEKGVWVDTTSYGPLGIEEISLFMEAMQTGVDTARYIQRAFVDPINNGAWNWTPLEP